MAREAIISNIGMVKDCRKPTVRGMAVITGIMTLNMIGRFTRSAGAIVAAATSTDNRGVVHLCKRHKGRCIVTTVTGVTGLNMRG